MSAHPPPWPLPSGPAPRLTPSSSSSSEPASSGWSRSMSNTPAMAGPPPPPPPLPGCAECAGPAPPHGPTPLSAAAAIAGSRPQRGCAPTPSTRPAQAPHAARTPQGACAERALAPGEPLSMRAFHRVLAQSRRRAFREAATRGRPALNPLPPPAQRALSRSMRRAGCSKGLQGLRRWAGVCEGSPRMRPGGAPVAVVLRG